MMCLVPSNLTTFLHSTSHIIASLTTTAAPIMLFLFNFVKDHTMCQDMTDLLILLWPMLNLNNILILGEVSLMTFMLTMLIYPTRLWPLSRMSQFFLLRLIPVSLSTLCFLCFQETTFSFLLMTFYTLMAEQGIWKYWLALDASRTPKLPLPPHYPHPPMPPMNPPNPPNGPNGPNTHGPHLAPIPIDAILNPQPPAPPTAPPMGPNPPMIPIFILQLWGDVTLTE